MSRPSRVCLVLSPVLPAGTPVLLAGTPVILARTSVLLADTPAPPPPLKFVCTVTCCYTRLTKPLCKWINLVKLYMHAVIYAYI